MAQPLLSDPRVVYLDNDPLIVRTGQNLLNGDEHTDYLHAGPRRAEHVLDYPDLRRLIETQHMRDGLALFTQLYGEPPAIPLREPEQLARPFTGLDLVEPGIVPVPLWHP